jgi:hypothetical protein
MKAKEYLHNLQRLDTLINQKIKELEDLRSTSTSIGSLDYSKDRVQSSPSGDAPFVKVIGRMIDLEEEINAEIDKFVDEKHDIINQIQQLQNPKHIEILYKHYVEFKRLEVISVEMGYTYQYIVELHGYALKEFQDTHENLLNTNV